jgi:hypothetical protein
MKNLRALIVFIFAATLLTAAQAWAQPRGGMMWRGSGGWGPGSPYNKMYDPKSLETVSGEVVNVDRIIPNKGMSNGVHLTLKTDKETVSVHLGPAWYLENQDVKIEKKNRIEVTGSRIIFGGKPAIVASEVRKGDEVLTLRDKEGLPLWSAWRRR